jgi:hypothetical protein
VKLRASSRIANALENTQQRIAQTINSTSEHARPLRKQGIKDGIAARDAPRAAVIELQAEADTPWLAEPAQALGGASAPT